MRFSHLPYVRLFSGHFQRLRRHTSLVLCLLFFGVPWLQYQDNPAILITLSKQQFAFFNLTFWPQDLPLLALFFIAAAFALFFITAFLGRIWCGFLCPQTVWSFAFLWIEEKLEGKANKRKKQDSRPLTRQLRQKKVLKHLIWLLISLVTAFTFIGYFLPIQTTILNFLTFKLTGWQTFWVSFMTLATYFNAGWMRSLICLHICPYARFQSVMFDKNTLTVSYDTTRGESRAPRKRSAIATDSFGDCIDCNLCVDVCPTGIDIRDGLQYQCIDCGACVDACNHTMSRMNLPKNLIGYQSEVQNTQPIWQRPKLMGYGVIFLMISGLFSLYAFQRSPVQFDVLRDRQALFQRLDNGDIRNTYQIKITNKTQITQTYSLSVNDPFKWQGKNTVTLKGGEERTLPIALHKLENIDDPHVMPINIKIVCEDKTWSQEKPQRFLTR
jgi:cytochrome c oxidase accessory protein FixG